jgi:hypothetical protein
VMGKQTLSEGGPMFARERSAVGSIASEVTGRDPRLAFVLSGYGTS